MRLEMAARDNPIPKRFLFGVSNRNDQLHFQRRALLSVFPFVADQWSGALRYLLNEKTMERKKIGDKDQISYEFFPGRKRERNEKISSELSISRSDVNG
jgi:hypothetical protein